MDMVSFDFLIEIGYSVHISTEIDSCQALLIRERLLACKKIHAIKLNSHDFISTDNEDVPVSFLSSEIIFGILTKNVQEKAATVDIPGLYGSTFSRKIKERSEFILKECVHARRLNNYEKLYSSLGFEEPSSTTHKNLPQGIVSGKPLYCDFPAEGSSQLRGVQLALDKLLASVKQYGLFARHYYFVQQGDLNFIISYARWANDCDKLSINSVTLQRFVIY
jgi:hypothetical protein